jgi:phospholipid:diacylglycerol acyltransferase
MAAFLSGEMKDTVQMNPAGAYGRLVISSVNLNLHTFPVVLERFFSREERKALFRSWAGSASMWIKVIAFFLNVSILLIYYDIGW